MFTEEGNVIYGSGSVELSGSIGEWGRGSGISVAQTTETARQRRRRRKLAETADSVYLDEAGRVVKIAGADGTEKYRADGD